MKYIFALIGAASCMTHLDSETARAVGSMRAQLSAGLADEVSDADYDDIQVANAIMVQIQSNANNRMMVNVFDKLNAAEVPTSGSLVQWDETELTGVVDLDDGEENEIKDAEYKDGDLETVRLSEARA